MNLDRKALIQAIEALPVDQIRVIRKGKSVQIYPWIKVKLLYKLVMGQESLKEKDNTALMEQLKTLPMGFMNFFRRFDFWVLSNTSERILLDGKYVDKLFEELPMATGGKVLFWESQLFKRIRKKDSASQYVLSRAWIYILEEFIARFFMRSYRLEGEEIVQHIYEMVGDEVATASIVKKNLAQYRTMRFYLRFMPHPKKVFLSVSYSNFGVIRALKEKGIEVIEMQHGLIGNEHIAYNYVARLESQQFPDTMVTFGLKDQRFFETQTNFPVAKIVPVGRSILDYYFEKSFENNGSIQRILVSLQDAEWSFHLLDFVLACNALMDQQIEWIIQTRRTPKETYLNRYEFPENIRFSEVSVYEAMTLSDAHLTIYSTTAIESLSLGKPVFCYNFQNNARKHLGPFIGENENAYFCDSPEEWLEQLKRLKYLRKEDIAASNNDNISFGFKRNLHQIIAELK